MGNRDTGVPNGGPRRLLTSWQEISSYIGRGVRTVQRYEVTFGLPVHRPTDQSRGTVIAFSDELDEWLSGTPVLSPRTPDYSTRALDSDYSGIHSMYRQAKLLQERSVQLCELMSTQVESMQRLVSRAREIERRAANGNGFPPRADFENLALDELLQTAIKITASDFGNVQLLDRESRVLKIVCHSGFRSDFLTFFKEVRGETTACGSAMSCRDRVIVEDVTSDSRYSPEGRRAMIEANAIACQSTPMLDASGRLFGVLNTHYRVPTRPTPSSLRQIDHLVGNIPSGCVPQSVVCR